MPETHIPARPVQKPLPIYVAGHTEAMFRAAAAMAIGYCRQVGSAAPHCSQSSMP
jgi:alkanesulfonate monooxygenase SsuD/methylene tetrahydromethanopterin reductase-like flavin-dependent oxidoreductase (luciferase family)